MVVEAGGRAILEVLRAEQKVKGGRAGKYRTAACLSYSALFLSEALE
jgi:hypothetical protein